jgi:carbonic anhydrase/acetyltransferase-like protein (isoleucine patch superfamily)
MEREMIKTFEGKTPQVPASSFVSEAAYVIGDVVLGENTGIWPGAVVRGDFAPIRIGSNTMIEDNSVVHTGAPLDIGDNVTLGHGVVMHGRSVGHNTLVGNNATILDDAQVGSFCIVGAGSLVSPGMKIPNGSLVMGVPAEIKGEISSRHRRRLEAGPQTYLELMRRYKKEGL